MSAAYCWTLLEANCVGCGICLDVCVFDAIAMPREAAYPAPGPRDCTGCMECTEQCPFDAIDVTVARYTRIDAGSVLSSVEVSFLA